MRQSLYSKVHRDILLEWIYDSNNDITEPFKVLKNNKDQTLSYVGGNLTINSVDNQLFPIDIVKNKWGKINTSTYNFLQLTDYDSQGPVRHDTIKLHLPSNYNFAEYQGILLRVYVYSFDNKKLINLSNFYHDKNDSNQSSNLDSITPPLLYEDRLWDKEITLEVPSANFISLQRTAGMPTVGSINDVLTNGVGISLTSPVLIDFHFITGINQIGTTKTFQVSTPFTIQMPQAPEYQELQLFAEESKRGDYFEFYPIYNNSFEDFQVWIDQSYTLNKIYMSEYLITLFEQNVKGKTTRFIIEDFSEIIEYRPIIKPSTTLASIDIELRLIDKVNGSVITRKATYGLKPNQISKYSLSIKKINIQNTQKPKIYVKKKIELAEVDSLTKGNLQEVVIDVNQPVLKNLNRLHAFSENDLNPKSEETLVNYHPMGEMKILLTPFDNILRFSLAFKEESNLEFVDLTNCQNLRICFKSDKSNYDFGLYTQEKSNLKNGGCVFRIPSSSYTNLKNMWLDKNNIFYITTINNNVQSVLYSGLFVPSDSKDAINIYNDTNTIDSTRVDVFVENPIVDEATVTRRQVRL